MIALLIALGDCAMAVLAASVAVIAVSGGYVFDVGGVRVSARSVGNPLLALALLAIVRWWTARTVPFLAARRLTPQSLEQSSLRLVESAVARLGAINMRGAVSVVFVLSAAMLIVKLAVIFRHPGFMTGDDVEIQEMTLGHLLGKSWSIWDIRSAVYPMSAVYPAQALAHALGATDTGTLVSVGRAAAATLSTGLLVSLFVAGRRLAGIPPALLAVTFASVSHLLVDFGASELPRPVSAVLIVAGFACVMGRTRGAALAAGSLVGVAATLRFSEAVFLVPGTLQLMLERRWQHLVIFSTGFIAAAGAIQLTADTLFWGSPLHSLANIVQYTLIERQSSRGFEPPWHYAAAVTSWTDPVVAVLAIAATSKQTWRPALWAWVPVVLLSLLPHKEARYLLPVMPFVTMLAGIKIWDLAQLARTRARSDRAGAGQLALALCAAVAASLTYQVGRPHQRRSDDAVHLARALAGRHRDGGLAVEQLWRMGGRLYVGQLSPLIDLDPAALAAPGGVAAAAENRAVRWIALRAPTCGSQACVETLAASGFEERRPPVPCDYRLFARAPP